MATSKRTNAPTGPTITRNAQKRKSVSNHNTSSHGPNSSRPLPTIPSCPPPSLLSMERHDMAANRFPFDTWDLDEIAKDNVTEHCLHQIDPDGLYMLSFLSYFDWWLRVAEELAGCLDCHVGETQLTDEHREFTRRLHELETDVLSRFADAHLGDPCFGVCTYKPKLALLKAYRHLTRFLSDTANSFWPEVAKMNGLLWLTHHS